MSLPVPLADQPRGVLVAKINELLQQCFHLNSAVRHELNLRFEAEQKLHNRDEVLKVVVAERDEALALYELHRDLGERDSGRIEDLEVDNAGLRERILFLADVLAGATEVIRALRQGRAEIAACDAVLDRIAAAR